jgi:hypothetical protein
MLVAAAVVSTLVPPLPREAAHISAGEFCGSTEVWIAAPLPKLYRFQCVAPTHQNPEFNIRTQ